ncbi:phosphoribosylglycinamide formyltransferase [Candidatus Endowatersipora endosymbiont of Watersipora subatra]|uniref:phosphoribosylglycinamide formyltransferase n=1 Tax=Candidatus Endowatersipora endosymbiont of Watersipora subatra TaxID=3077946 RepID=UPI00312CBC4A
MKKVRVAVLISGRGSNMISLVESAKDTSYPADISLIISNNPNADGVKSAQKRGIPTHIVDNKFYESREEHEQAIHELLIAYDIDIICLAGYMRVLTQFLVSAWLGRILNIHPSLLPLFPGLNTHKRALDSGIQVHGCTVHFVNSQLDGGLILTQSTVPVLPDDDIRTLAYRVLEMEHILYPKTLALVATRKLSYLSKTRR